MDQAKDFLNQLLEFIMFFINAIKELVAGVRGPSLLDKITTKAPEATDATETV